MFWFILYCQPPEHYLNILFKISFLQSSSILFCHSSTDKPITSALSFLRMIHRDLGLPSHHCSSNLFQIVSCFFVHYQSQEPSTKGQCFSPAFSCYCCCCPAYAPPSKPFRVFIAFLVAFFSLMFPDYFLEKILADSA